MNTNKFFLVIGVLGAFCLLPFLSNADEDEALSQKSAEKARIEREIEKYRSEISDRGDKSLSTLREKIDAEMMDFDFSREQTEKIEKELREIQKEMTTLGGQIQALDEANEITKKQIETVKIRIMERVADIAFLSEEKEKIISQKERALRAVLSFFALLQIEDGELSPTDEIHNTLRLLLSDESFSQNFWKSEQNAGMERAGRKIFHDFEAKEEELKEVERLLNLENSRLSELYDRKKMEEKNVNSQIAARARLKNIAEFSEIEFQKLLEESREQMRESISSIDLLRTKYASIEQKLADFSAQEEEEKETESEFFQKADEIGEEILEEEQSKSPLSWPVNPKKGLSATFLDSEYEKIFGISHNAIDIPVPQGSTIFAPALGYVYKVSDNGNGYSSLIVAHQNNILTVYGHVSKFLVKEGDLVRSGDPLALSGGMPGTAGAGWMTTGPHLHFEVLKNGKYLDPLDFLPPMPEEEILEKEIENEGGEEENEEAFSEEEI